MQRPCEHRQEPLLCDQIHEHENYCKNNKAMRDTIHKCRVTTKINSKAEITMLEDIVRNERQKVRQHTEKKGSPSKLPTMRQKITPEAMR